MIVAIDGPAGAGKSTIAKMIAARQGLMFMNTGSFYRGVTLALLRSRGGSPDGSGAEAPDLRDEAAIVAFAAKVPLDYREGHLFIGEEDVDRFLRTDAVEAFVAPLSGIVEVRHIVNEKIRKVAKARGVVCEGRDMTTVVFPDADHKFYLDASVESRARRRFDQGTSALTIDQIRKNIEERDYIDRNKKEGSLKIAPDAVYIDTSDLTIAQVCDMIVSKIHL
ncbi:MAG TPA: (d)CMP kinase [Treponemataceae bacterium]|nr:(d)CMP kinase [Treponemataceae bacterium]